ncbi:hypothetical protein MML48_2g00001859 [Holotrichia oblita]|uniref:Uncharacterized protein n=1 Tax=Holotrichia oblita TaxID=644536 RepID=A0ACB9TM75_HOLOL|nr:hypothetical protein MML48_2g00001859 [Holotrichia oblita]
MAAAAGYFAVLINNEIQNEYRRNRVRYINRNLRDSSNPFELPERNFVKIFRLSKESARYVINTILPHLNEPQRSTSIPPHLGVLCVLHFLGHGSYQESVGRGWNFAISQPAVSKCITQVTNAINNELNNWIVFPQDNQSIQRNKQVFFEQYGFPGIVGAIDCSHVAIVAPPANHHLYPAAAYYNRKGFYSINVQLIVDANLKIINVNARFPGSVHDAAIWRMSNINWHLENRYLNDNLDYHLIGDEGYRLSPWLLVKYPGNHPQHTPEGRYNNHIVRARSVVERVIGILKCRFRCLLRHRTLHYSPIKAAQIITSCAILHNIAMTFNVPVIDEYIQENIRQNDMPGGVGNFFMQGVQKREILTQQYFN